MQQHLSGFEQVTSEVRFASGDRLEASSTVYDILLVRDDHVILRDLKTSVKVVMHIVTHTTAGSLKLYRKPSQQIIDPTPVKTGFKRGSSGPTKLMLCRDIYVANPGGTKQELLDLFVNKAGCTPAGANTYLCLLRKEMV